MAIHGIMRGGTVDPLVGASLTVTGTSALGGQVDFTGVQTDTSVGTQDDFALQSGITVLRVNPASTVTYDGFTGGVAGRILLLVNVSSQVVILNNEAAGSTAANRILGQVGANCTLNGAGANANSDALLIYDGVASRWRVIATNTNIQSANQTFSGRATFSSDQLWAGQTSPTALSGSTNDYAPSNHATVSTYRQDVSSAAVLTGLIAESNGAIRTITNIATAAANTLTLSHESTSSTAANRFSLLNGTPVVLGPGASITLRYDGTSVRWRPIHQTATSPMGSGSPDGVLTGAAGQEYTDTTTLVKWQNTDGATAWDPIFIPASAGFRLEDDLINASIATALTGGGAIASSSEPANPGLVISTVTAVNDGVSYASGSVGRMAIGGGMFRARIKLRVATLSNGVNNIIVRAGAGNVTTGGDNTNGVYYEYDFATNGDHKWRLCTAQGGTRTKTDTGILAVASSTTMTTLELTVNAGATSVTGKINGVAVATPVTTNIPSGSSQPFAGYSASALKQLGAGGLTMTIDRLESMVVLTAAR